jgi:hypothetical protein
MALMYEGWNVEHLSQEQTLNPKPKRDHGQWFTGYQKLGMEWYDYPFIPEIPLDVRYESFKRRLATATDNIGKAK